MKKSLLIPPASEGVAVFMTRTTYAASVGESLIQEYSELTASDTFGRSFLRRSTNNGATWSEPTLISQPQPVEGGMLRRGEFAHLLDERRNRLIRFYNQSVYPDDKTYSRDVVRTHRLWYEISHDAGATFSQPQQLIVSGHDATAWAPDVQFGKNGSMISFSQPFVDPSGRIILPAQWVPVLAADHAGLYPLEALCYIGTSADDGSLTWEASTRVSLEAARSIRGLCEPTIAPIAHDRLLMICRGSNAGHPDMPGRKWMSLSTDGGHHWDAPRPLGSTTGELFYSPATGSRLIRSSRTGKLSWIGNILPHNPNGNGPRHPLCIAEVDEQTPALIKDSVRIIDDRHPEDTPRLQLSNFHVYEDRATGEFVLTMSRLFERSESSLTSPAYQYRFAC